MVPGRRVYGMTQGVKTAHSQLSFVNLSRCSDQRLNLTFTLLSVPFDTSVAMRWSYNISISRYAPELDRVSQLHSCAGTGKISFYR